MSLKFELWSADDIRASAVCHVREHRMRLAERRNSVFDERMGPMMYMEDCATCGSDVNDCVGHCKRVNYSARTVITADPNLALDEVGVPKSVAMQLTYPERACAFNLHELRAAVRTGPHALGGALYVRRRDGFTYDLAFVACTAEVARKLNPGDVVDRMLRDGDVVVMNRQPSLHKMSMMAHRVKVLDYSTFRLNLSVTTPYNAASTM